jgi:large subunit ribosomal protein L23
MGLLDRFKKTKKEEKKKEIKKPRVSVVKKAPKTEKPKAEKPKSTKKITKKEFSGAWQVLKMPIVTEKSTDLNALNQYIFKVANSANKAEIKKAIQDLYGVRVESVNIIKVPGKKRRLGRHEGWRAGYKKAIVFLAPEEKIEILAR